MNNILVIDKGSSSIHNFSNILKNKDFSITKVKGLKEALPYLKRDTVDLIVIDKAFSSTSASFRNFVKLISGIPKLILIYDRSFRGMGVWLKDRLAVPVHEPVSYREFEYHIERLLKDKKTLKENKTLDIALRAKRKELGFFEDITRILISSLSMKKILAMIMRKTKAMIGAEAWSILLLDEEGEELYFERVQGKETKKVKKFRIKVGEGIAGWVAKEGVPVIVPDVGCDARFSGKIDKLLDFKTRSLMCIPIKIEDKVIGVLEIVNKVTGEPFTKDDLDLILKFVNHAAMAIERASLYLKMEELTLTDDVTNLFNTRYLNRAIEIEIERSDRYGSPFTVIFMDIDSFKKVNDQHGHLVGGKVLREMSQLLLNSLRTVDIVARYGGDEFVVVLPQTTPKAGFYVGERLRKAVEQHVFLKNEGYHLRITASFGVASYPENAKSKEELFRIADEAMYKGKFSTKNIVYAAVK
ncbi:MAG TPA: sensor domain-containing diguanylate cyclase [Nitrospirae bacterium]|nr:response regulator PleD [bacterium BMS3Abin10]GBE38395.1 response regulator PleD [bacterium BMS3Bbin08]HDK41157.1 sensor domain-containing diguanylate cyclase [Nitrospirota bacterium]HDK82408.1 sensor domain-containing diguanylate cyclase [Nitrospirota bacterium]